MKHERKMTAAEAAEFRARQMQRIVGLPNGKRAVWSIPTTATMIRRRRR